MNFSEITPYLIAANIIQTWALGFYVHLTSKNKAITDRLDAMEHVLSADLADHAQRLTRLEASQANAPTHQDIDKVIDKVYDKLNRVAESGSRMEGTLEQVVISMRQILARITEKGMS
jgi:methyl-accepting chemotaxis protein